MTVLGYKVDRDNNGLLMLVNMFNMLLPRTTMTELTHYRRKNVIL